MKILNLFIFVVSTVFLFSCASLTEGLLKDPEVKVVDFTLQDISIEDVALNLKVNVNNPNPIPLNLDQINYELKFSGEKVTEGIFSKGISIPASGSNEVMIPLKFKYSSVGNILAGIFKNSYSREYELSGSAKLGIISVPFTKKGELSLRK
jgi:LEA14-like dessication related protein